MLGPSVCLWKHPQNIHPFFLWCLSTIQVGSYSSPGRRVTQLRVCLPPVIQVSSVHNIWYHCSIVHCTCSRAQASRCSRFVSVIRGFRIAGRRWKPSLKRAVRITCFLTPKSITSASCTKLIRRFLADAQTNSTSSSTWACVRTGGRPDLFLGVARAPFRQAPAIWWIVKVVCGSEYKTI